MRPLSRLHRRYQWLLGMLLVLTLRVLGSPAGAAMTGAWLKLSQRTVGLAAKADGSGLQEVAFKAGPDHGMFVFWDTGEVVHVVEGGQAYLKGVREGQFLTAVNGHRFSHDLFEEASNGVAEYTMSFEKAWKIGPAAVASVPGRRLHHAFKESPASVGEASENELTKLEGERLGHAEGDEEAIRKMREDKRCQEVAELMYVMVWAGLRKAGVEPVVQSLRAGGHVRLPPCKDEVLTAMHTSLCLKAVQEHLNKSMSAIPDGGVQLSLLNVGQAYAMSTLFGYTLRHAQERFNLEQLMGGMSASDVQNDALMRYIDMVLATAGAAGEFTCMTSTKEAQGALMMQVEGLFGDLTELRAQLISLMSQDPSHELDWQRMVREGKITSLRFGSADMRRLILEAVAFGSILHESEKQFRENYELSPADDPRVDEFGFDTDERGFPINPARR